jgi:hypothetical protein
VAALQVDEFRSALRQLERERDSLREEKDARDKAAAATSAALAAATRRAGSGSLGELMAAGANGFGGAGHAGGGLQTPAILGGRASLDPTDLLYLKNVLLKFVDAQLGGRAQECEVLLPAVAALLRATPAEYRVLRDSLQRSQQPLGWLYPLAAAS